MLLFNVYKKLVVGYPVEFSKCYDHQGAIELPEHSQHNPQ